MKILSIQNDFDAGCALIENNKIIEVLNEERFSRIKLHEGFPHLSLKYLFKKHNLRPTDIDKVAYGWYGNNIEVNTFSKKLVRRIVTAVNNDPKCGDLLVDRLDIEISRDENVRNDFEHEILKLGFTKDTLVYLDHHTSHAWAAFSTSPFKESFIFTFDGRGDFKSSTFFYYNKKLGMQEIDYQLTVDSIGYLYSQITEYLGFKPHRHEGKVTGLAAYGNANKTLKLFEKVMVFKEGNFISNLGFYRPFTSPSNELAKELKKFSKEDIAAGLQTHCEILVSSYIRYWIKKMGYKSKNICLAGGVAANVRINQVISNIKGVDNIFVFPHMGDGGIPLGAAAYLNYNTSGKAKLKFDTAQLGIEYSDIDIMTKLQKYKKLLIIEKPKNYVNAVIEDLINAKVIGWFQGKMEYGPRALGGRSILFHAQDKTCNDWLNKRMNRTEFMPFGPVTPIDFAKECYIGFKENDLCTPYMTKTFHCKKSFIKNHPAVVHLDKTSRPQIVTPKRNGIYYKVLKGYCEKTGYRALINTSFNAHEEPIVYSPEDAVEGLLNNMIDILYIGSFKILKKGNK